MKFFQQNSAVPLYFARINEKISQTVCYYQSGSVTGGSLDLSQAWGNKGCFIFLSEAPWSLSTLATDIESYLTANSTARFVWIPATISNTAAWVSFSLSGQSGNTAFLSEQTTFNLRNYTLNLKPGLTISCDNDGFTLQNMNNSITLGVNTVILPIGSTASISLESNSKARCIDFSLSLTNEAFTNLDVGLRYFQNPQASQLTSFFYPIFDAQEISIDASVDPTAYQNCFFAFTDSVTIPSFFRTIFGKVVSLMPQPGAGLVFTSNPATTTPAPTDPLYLAPTGAFMLSASSPSGLMCGLSGTEHITNSSDQQMLHFIPNMPACASSGSSQDKLTSTATTSWVYITSDNIFYVAQPKGAVLFGKGESSEFLDAQEVPSASLPNTDQVKDLAFPMAPYAGIQNATTQFVAFENDTLVHARKHKIDQLNGGPA